MIKLVFNYFIFLFYCNSSISEELDFIEPEFFNQELIKLLKTAQKSLVFDNNYKQAVLEYEQAVNQGSLYATLNFSSLVKDYSPDRYENTELLLKNLASIGILTAKTNLIGLCQKSLNCDFSVFHNYVELALLNPRLYSSRLLCYVSDNKTSLSKHELILSYSLINHLDDQINKSSNCYKKVSFLQRKDILTSDNDRKYFTNLRKWFLHRDEKVFLNDSDQILSLMQIEGILEDKINREVIK